MKKEKATETELPEVTIIDLDKLEDNTDINYDEIVEQESMTFDPEAERRDYHTDNSEKPGLFHHILKINWHLILLAVIVFSVIFIVHRITNWGVRVDLNKLGDNINTEFDIEVEDTILPLIYEGDAPAAHDNETVVVLLGNDTFAQNRGTSDDMATRIADLSGATVYNCAVTGSYLTASNSTFDYNVDPMDAFNLYWLTTMFTLDNTQPCEQALQNKKDDLPAEAKEVFELLNSIDFNTVDVIGIMYDAHDYLDGRSLINLENSNDIQSYLGNFSASVELIQEIYPHIRIIVMSPTYAYAIDEDGLYSSSELVKYDEYTLSYYASVLGQTAVSYGISYVDNLYGTVNETNADQYLLDYINLNVNGRQKLAERFVYALEYYNSLKD